MPLSLHYQSLAWHKLWEQSRHTASYASYGTFQGTRYLKHAIQGDPPGLESRVSRHAIRRGIDMEAVIVTRASGTHDMVR